MSIILTGGSGGIGRAIGDGLSKIDQTYPLYNNTELKQGVRCDITNHDQIKTLGDVIPLTHITLIHLAALKIDELAVVVDEKNWDRVMNVNLKGAFFLTKALLPIMMREKWGRIIWAMSSGLGDVGTITYSTSKYALLGMSEVLSREYAKYGITSNVLQLGYFKTGMWEKLSEPKKQELLNQIPNKQLGNPQNISNAIEFLIKSDYVNGGVLSIDGGI